MLLVGALLGGYFGARIGKRASARVVRGLTLALSLVVKLFLIEQLSEATFAVGVESNDPRCFPALRPAEIVQPR